MLCSKHSFVYFGGESRCTKCYAEFLPSGKVIPWKGKGKPGFIKTLESPGYKDYKTPKPMPKAKRKPPGKWAAHLKAYRKAHPGKTLSECMKAASKTYKKK